MLYKNFIWDFDGTLADTYPYHTEALVRALKTYPDAPEYSAEEIYARMKINLGKGINPYKEACPGVKDKYKAFYTELRLSGVIPPCKGAVEMVKAVNKAGGRNFLYTHSANYTKDMLAQYGILDCFDGFVTSECPADRKFPLKPKPDAVLYLLAEYGLDPEETVMVGDREIDVLAGMNAGTKACMFDEGGYYKDSTATHYVTRLKDFARMCGVGTSDEE